MLVSTLIRDLVDEAENYFGVGNHLHDCISVGMYVDDANTWQAWLERPTQTQMDRGEFDRFETVRTFENSIACYVENQPTLVDALLAVREKLDRSLEWGTTIDYEPELSNEDEETVS